MAGAAAGCGRGPSEVLGIAFAAVVLFVTLGTVVAAGLPVLLAVLGVGISVAAIFALSAVVDLTETDPVLALMLGLSLGIDYTLLLLHRHRQNLLRGMGVQESIRLASGTAGSAIFFAGLTNVIALAALAVTGIPFLTVMGLAASLAVTIVVAAVLTLGPALASLLGLRLLPRRLRPGSLSVEDVGSPLPTPEQNRLSAAEQSRVAESARHRLMDRGWGRMVTWHRAASILVPLLLAGALAVPAADLRLGLPDGAGENGPVLVLAILVCGVLFGLAVDYQLFIMSGVREAYSRGRGAKVSILSGIAQGGPVVVACGIIMVSVFAGFASADLAMIRPIGFGLAVGVLIEAFLVRATLIPAVTGLLGEAAWYLPRWMDRLLPDVDVEGEALEDQAPTETPSQDHPDYAQTSGAER